MSLKLKTATLGCKVNQYETELVREGLLNAGYQDAQDRQPADLCVVNTCTVTAEGDAKSRQVIRKLARGNPQARIVVMGCYATRAPAELWRLPGVVEVVTDKRELPDLLGRFGVVEMPRGVSGLSDRHRAYVKVQDGCLLNCSFCIIPQVRPHMVSRPPHEILAEVQGLVERGYREIVLTGIHLGHYGVDFNKRLPKRRWTRLSHLVDRLAELPGDFRLRLSSIEATEVTHELIAVMANHAGRVCPHLHVSMQSGSDAVLRRMRRRWGSRRYVDRCQMFRQRLDQAAITTDIIVGFPGETEDDFGATCRVAREVGFSKIHIFPFSARRGTPAAEMPGQLPKSVKQQRARHLAEVEAELRDDYFRGLLGRRLQVLVEGTSRRDAESLTGTSCRYAPVDLPAGTATAGEFVTVTAASTAHGRIRGQEGERRAQ
ncbi:MAG: tRNA (N(6)-L-threonylcarbamoyladenosine(37)-C(2))-methylthiotransferase MtaB [Planctomycetales bacterium]|nr:tRNA (N(6)-L-threonylcarbamoyladenosine(37)-C(2))-methylthiotransferase MtaB [Planctomycetales bacterium]NIM07861.1 tRNA (N(6)-L-threonylcarbamoyladenosine(37)-C(2))-methylthiotransferase MtaB [Planctomycetales bacterium]NIN07350.1 tRNA (N(6)-L-threonylcarbamoyladenosine(37)-C(2))-methylthiotransferase MtaB [Planctomycetales bacterium]NIN76454.1 tRNA (N(6)-L-threonylcarbamoyladenosine(37)-C(2))-methylthiotransferase MtaB [Planctomycetales bacterium]NIO33645.1 tRNA (N(6)-L-threonylcarbamoylad